jgi:hypothetical protein
MIRVRSRQRLNCRRAYEKVLIINRDGLMEDNLHVIAGRFVIFDVGFEPLCGRERQAHKKQDR